MFRRSPQSRRRAAAVALASLAFAAVLASSTAGVASPARAGGQAAVAADPVARLQVIVKQVYVASDRDIFGGGEMILETQFFRCRDTPGACLGQQGLGPRLAYAVKTFSASSGDTKTLDLVLPRAEDRVEAEYDASDAGGFPVYAGERYSLHFDMRDDDPSGSDYMGNVHEALFVEADWQVGAHSTWSEVVSENRRGDYRIDYEIRRMSLPDLKPKALRVVDDAASTEDVVCLEAENIGPVESGPFQMTLNVDTTILPRNGAVDMTSLAPGQSRESCIRTTLPTSGVHKLSLTVDGTRAVPEMNELNNEIDQKLNRSPFGQTVPTGPLPGLSADPGSDPGTTPPQATPTPTAIPTQPDLTVSAIRIRGKVPNGNDDCKDGKNDVTVTVKNVGTGNAGSFVVRLVVDGDDNDADEKSVNGLDAGKEREISFDDILLKKGDRALRAIADVKTTVAESREDNNDLKVTAKCKDDD